MAINAKNDSKPKELMPAGNYIARCYQMIELGTADELYMGETKSQTKVRIGWEFPNEKKVFDEAKGEQPLVISKEYVLSMYDKANLRKDLESWRGSAFTPEQAKCFDITKLLGIPCMINVIHKPSEKDPTKLYERISGITPMPKGVVCPPPINDVFVLSFDAWSEDKFKSLPEFIRKRIMESEEYKAMVAPKAKEDVRETSSVSNPNQVPDMQDGLPF